MKTDIFFSEKMAIIDRLMNRMTHHPAYGGHNNNFIRNIMNISYNNNMRAFCVFCIVGDVYYVSNWLLHNDEKFPVAMRLPLMTMVFKIGAFNIHALLSKLWKIEHEIVLDMKLLPTSKMIVAPYIIVPVFAGRKVDQEKALDNIMRRISSDFNFASVTRQIPKLFRITPRVPADAELDKILYVIGKVMIAEDRHIDSFTFTRDWWHKHAWNLAQEARSYDLFIDMQKKYGITLSNVRIEDFVKNAPLNEFKWSNYTKLASLEQFMEWNSITRAEAIEQLVRASCRYEVCIFPHYKVKSPLTASECVMEWYNGPANPETKWTKFLSSLEDAVGKLPHQDLITKKLQGEPITKPLDQLSIRDMKKVINTNTDMITAQIPQQQTFDQFINAVMLAKFQEKSYIGADLDFDVDDFNPDNEEDLNIILEAIIYLISDPKPAYIHTKLFIYVSELSFRLALVDKMHVWEKIWTLPQIYFRLPIYLQLIARPPADMRIKN